MGCHVWRRTVLGDPERVFLFWLFLFVLCWGSSSSTFSGDETCGHSQRRTFPPILGCLTLSLDAAEKSLPYSPPPFLMVGDRSAKRDSCDCNRSSYIAQILSRRSTIIYHVPPYSIVQCYISP